MIKKKADLLFTGFFTSYLSSIVKEIDAFQSDSEAEEGEENGKIKSMEQRQGEEGNDMDSLNDLSSMFKSRVVLQQIVNDQSE